MEVVIDPLTMSLILGGTGLLTTKMNNDRQADANRANAMSAAAQTQFSPYTKMKPGSYQAQPLQNEVGGAMNGAVTGLQLSQNYNKATADQNMMNKSFSNSGNGQYQATSPWVYDYSQPKSNYAQAYS
jgi:hypothetical protein